MYFLKQNRIYHRISTILLTLVLCASMMAAMSLTGLCDGADSIAGISDGNGFDAFKDFVASPIGIVCLAAVVVVLLIVVIFMIQWRRVVRRKTNPKEVDWSSDARQSIEQARQLLETGLLKAVRSEFGDTAPEDSASLQKFIANAYGLHAGGLYVSVDALSAFVRQLPHIFLQGSDSLGGESVLTLLVNETAGERFFYLQGLSICYRRENYRRSVRYNIRFSLEKPNRPIEEVLEFEVV